MPITAGPEILRDPAGICRRYHLDIKLVESTRRQNTMVTAEFVKSIFTALANGDAPTFFNNVADNVSWRVTGTDNPLSGNYNSKAEFVPKTFQRLGKLMEGPMKLEVVNVMVDGNMAAVELKANAKAKSGTDFANEYCWVCRFENEKIVQVRAYLDSALVKRVIEENE
jgi:uncharacterized protein